MKFSGILIAIVLVLALFALAAFIIMLVGNVVLGYYNVKVLDYPTALAVTLLLSIFGGAVRGAR